MERLWVTLLWIYFGVAPLYALGSLVNYIKKMNSDGFEWVLEFIGFVILSSLKGLIWPIAMWF